MSAAQAYPVHEPTADHAANDNTAPLARAKLKLRLAAQRPIDSQDRLPRYAYDSLGNLRRKDYTGGQYDGRNIELKYINNASTDYANNTLQYSHDRDANGDFAYTGHRWYKHDRYGNVPHMGPVGGTGLMHLVHDMTNRPVKNYGKGLGSNGSDRVDMSIDHLYDGHNRRVKSVDEGGNARYNIFDAAGQLLQVYDAGTDTRTDYIPGPNGALARIKRAAGVDTASFIHADHLGTGRVGTSALGAVLWEDFHTPFGESLLHPDATDDQGDFTGHIRDKASGLTYMQARYYDPVAGQLLSVDPVTFMDKPYPGQFNRYAYTWNDPINANDPDGELLNFVIGAAIGAAIETGSQLIANGGDFSALDGGAILKSGGVGALTGGIGGALAKQGATRAIGGLSNQAKGRLGETIVRGKLALKGQKVIATQTKASQVPGLQNVTGRGANSVVDFAVRGKNGATKVIDAKFTTTGKVSNTGAQRHLKSQIGDNFSNAVVHADDVATAAGRAGAVVGGAAGGGASTAHNRCQDNGNC